jgi:hypothetical protein
LLRKKITKGRTGSGLLGTIRWCAMATYSVACEAVVMCRNPSLGLMTKAKACKNKKQKGDPVGTSYIPKSAKSVKEWTLTLPMQLPFGELESQRALKSSGSNCRH